MGTFLVVGSPKGPHFLPRSLFSLFQAEERAKSESIHYLLNVDHLNPCDGKTSLNESHASLSVKFDYSIKGILGSYLMNYDNVPFIIDCEYMFNI